MVELAVADFVVVVDYLVLKKLVEIEAVDHYFDYYMVAYQVVARIDHHMARPDQASCHFHYLASSF